MYRTIQVKCIKDKYVKDVKTDPMFVAGSIYNAEEKMGVLSSSEGKLANLYCLAKDPSLGSNWTLDPEFTDHFVIVPEAVPSDKELLYGVVRNVKCRSCGNKGAVIPDSVRKSNYSIDPLLFPGGTASLECLNCGNSGLSAPPGSDFTMEGLSVAFDSLPEVFEKGQKVFHRTLRMVGKFETVDELDTTSAHVEFVEEDGYLDSRRVSISLLTSKIPVLKKKQEFAFLIEDKIYRVERELEYPNNNRVRTTDGTVDAFVDARLGITGKRAMKDRDNIIKATLRYDDYVREINAATAK